MNGKWATEKVLPLLVVVIGLTFSQAAYGGEMLGLGNQTVIDGWALSGARGLVGVNMAAGDNHAQANVRIMGFGGSIPVGLVSQAVESEGVTPLYASNRIGGHAFSGVSGIISVNQAAGRGSAECNVVLLGFGAALNPLDPVQLEQTVGSRSSGARAAGEWSDIIDGHAFEGSCGLVQVNQSAGVANAASNRVVIGVRFENL